jgi:glycosyltransferase involved in cell wall biosynthesis
MKILIVNTSVIPVNKYGGTERVIWDLGKELVQLGHEVTYLVQAESSCPFAKVIFLDSTKPLAQQIPDEIDFVHFNFAFNEEISKPYLITHHGNRNDFYEFDVNSVFVSENHAARFGSQSFVHNGLDWNNYEKPNLTNERNYFHFLGKAAWRLKNVQGAIDVILKTKKEKLKVLGGHRFNINMGFRFTPSPRIRFHGMIGGEEKNQLLQNSKGLIFPVKWHEPFGLAITESLYFGCPVFGTPYGSLTEIVHKEVGLLSNSSAILSEAIENANSFSKIKCHEYANEMFNSKKMALSYLEKYNIILNGGQLNENPPKLLQLQETKFLEWN